VKDPTFTAKQVDFIGLIIEHLTATSVVEPGRLYESPFTDHAPLGPHCLFTAGQLSVIVVILDDIRQKAIA